MSIVKYDLAEPAIGNHWIDPRYFRLYSKTIKYRPYYIFLKRYNEFYKSWDYFIQLSDEKVINAVNHGTVRNKGIIKIDLSGIWCDTSLVKLTKKENVSVELVEDSEHSTLYSIDI